MKTCSKCNIKKPLNDFYKNLKNKKTGLSTWCKECQKSDKKVDYQKNKDRYLSTVFKNSKWFMELKTGLKCNRCGFDHPAALDFHHLNPNEKEFSISMNKTYYKNNKEALLEEIKKCEVLCANCHRIEHAVNYNKIIGGLAE